MSSSKERIEFLKKIKTELDGPILWRYSQGPRQPWGPPWVLTGGGTPPSSSTST